MLHVDKKSLVMLLQILEPRLLFHWTTQFLNLSCTMSMKFSFAGCKIYNYCLNYSYGVDDMEYLLSVSDKESTVKVFSLLLLTTIFPPFIKFLKDWYTWKNILLTSCSLWQSCRLHNFLQRRSQKVGSRRWYNDFKINLCY